VKKIISRWYGKFFLACLQKIVNFLFFASNGLKISASIPRHFMTCFLRLDPAFAGVPFLSGVGFFTSVSGASSPMFVFLYI